MPRNPWFTGRQFSFGAAFANSLRSLTLLSLPLLSPVLGSPLVKSVVVVGASVPVNLGTQAGQPYDDRAIEKDVRTLWSKGGFADILVETTEETEGTTVVFHITPEPNLRLRYVRIEPSSFGLHPKVTEGTPVSRLRAHEIAIEARKRLKAEGYLNAQVDYDLVPVSKYVVDVRLTVREGDAVDVRAVAFVGDPGLDVKELRGALRNTRIRRVVPGIPGLWAGWRMLPAYNADAIDADLNRLRSLYLSKGYFDARVRLAGTEIQGKSAFVKLDVQSGARYRVREWAASGPGIANAQVHPGDGVMPMSALCSCLLAGRRDAERRGILDFSAKLAMQRVDAGSGASPVADLTATMAEGQPYHVGRIEFTGNRHFRDATVRRNFLLDEGDWLDRRLLRKSIARLNQTMQFEPVDVGSIGIHPHTKTGDADVDIRLTERNRRAWSISGPIGPVSFAGPLQASLSSRLPPWGRGLFELSTYAASVTLLAFAHPLLPFLSLTSKSPWLPILALERPFTPGEGWRSGFVLAPQMAWRPLTLSYATSQLQHRLLPTLAGDRGLEPELPVTMERPQGDTMLFCEPPKPRFAKLRVTVAMLIQFLGR